MATMKQVAEMAGVSRGTVDRVLNNRGGVNAQTERRIREIAAMVNYVPNKAGKTLSVRKKNLKFGMILLNSKRNNPFIIDMESGARRESQKLADYGVTVELRQTQLGCLEQQLARIDKLVAQGIQVVTVNTDLEDSGRIAYVGNDNIEDGRTAASKNLLKLLSGIPIAQ